MKINGMNGVGPVNRYQKQQDSVPFAAAGKNNKKKDQVEISNEAKELLGVQGTASSEKIEALKKSVQSGTYHVDARKLADKIYPFLK